MRAGAFDRAFSFFRAVAAGDRHEVNRVLKRRFPLPALRYADMALRILVSNDDGVCSPGIAAPLRLDLTDEQQLAAMQSTHPLAEPE
jgi:hypothetical protein